MQHKRQAGWSIKVEEVKGCKLEAYVHQVNGFVYLSTQRCKGNLTVLLK